MPSKSHGKFTKNKADIARLWEIHEAVAGSGVGRKHAVEVLNRSAIVFITSCWEAYVEDVAMEAFDWLLANAPAADSIPLKVRTLAVRDILAAEKKDALVWNLADSKWRSVLEKHRDKTKKKWVNPLNTPKSSQVEDLFETVLGLRALCRGWRWRGMSAANAVKKLDNYVSLRGQIAHRLKGSRSVHKATSRDYLAHVSRLVDMTDHATRSHLVGTVGKSPWPP